jgi:hypothetical protein
MKHSFSLRSLKLSTNDEELVQLDFRYVKMLSKKVMDCILLRVAVTLNFRRCNRSSHRLCFTIGSRTQVAAAAIIPGSQRNSEREV